MTQAAPNNYSITSLGIDYLPKARNFLRQFYGDDFYGAEELYFNWQFLQVPCDWFEPIAAQGKMPVNAILDANDAVSYTHLTLPTICSV